MPSKRKATKKPSETTTNRTLLYAVFFIIVGGLALHSLSELKGDIQNLKSELKGDIQNLKSEFSDLRTELKGDIRNLSRDIRNLSQQFSDLRTELKGDISDLKSITLGLAPDLRGSSVFMFAGPEPPEEGSGTIVETILGNKTRKGILTVFHWAKRMFPKGEDGRADLTILWDSGKELNVTKSVTQLKARHVWLPVSPEIGTCNDVAFIELTQKSWALVQTFSKGVEQRPLQFRTRLAAGAFRRTRLVFEGIVLEDLGDGVFRSDCQSAPGFSGTGFVNLEGANVSAVLLGSHEFDHSKPPSHTSHVDRYFTNLSNAFSRFGDRKLSGIDVAISVSQFVSHVARNPGSRLIEARCVSRVQMRRIQLR